MRSRKPTALSVLCMVSALAASATAQCGAQWLPGFGCAGVDGPVLASVRWDPDGAGPAPEVVVLGGELSLAGSIPCAGVVAWQPVTGAFAAIPAPPVPVNGRQRCTALTVDANGALVGAFLSASGLWRVASFDGVQWTVLGGGFGGQINALVVRPNGELIAGGTFPTVGGSAGGNLARWTGSQWLMLGGGLGGAVSALANDINGDLLVVGDFLDAGGFLTGAGIPAGGVARWNGANWIVPPPALSGLAKSIAVSGSHILVGFEHGLFDWSGGAVVQVTGIGYGTASPASVYSLATLANGNVVVGGAFDRAGGVLTSCIAVLDPVSRAWTTLGAGVGVPNLGHPLAIVELANGDLVVGGSFEVAGARSVARVARWNGAQWSALADGVAPRIACGAAIDDVRFAVGGTFRSFGNVAATNVALWTGSTWAPLGAGLGGPVRDLVRLPSGDLVAAGGFTTSGAGAVARGIARWDGVAWSEYAGGLQSVLGAISGDQLLLRRNGELVVRGRFTLVGGAVAANAIAIWDGATWTSPAGLGSSDVVALAEAANGDLLVGVQVAGGAVVKRWNGFTWTDEHLLTSGEQIAALAGLPNGDIAVAGSFYFFGSNANRGYVDIVSNGVANRYLAVQSRSSVSDLAVLPGGDLLISGTFAGLLDANLNVVTTDRDVARLRGATFVPPPLVPNAIDHDSFPNGDVLLVGPTALPGQSVHLAGRLSSSCPASRQPAGTGCSTGVLTSSLPWIGSEWRASASGLPSSAMVFAVTGLATAALPLQNVIPTALPGCVLRVQNDVVLFSLAAAGTASTRFPLPQAPALVGATFRHQVVAVALDGTLATTATNALLLTVGAF